MYPYTPKLKPNCVIIHSLPPWVSCRLVDADPFEGEATDFPVLMGCSIFFLAPNNPHSLLKSLFFKADPSKKLLPEQSNLNGHLWVSACQCSGCGVPVVSPAAFLYWLKKKQKPHNILLQRRRDIATPYVWHLRVAACCSHFITPVSPPSRSGSPPLWHLRMETKENSHTRGSRSLTEGRADRSQWRKERWPMVFGFCMKLSKWIWDVTLKRWGFIFIY